MQVDAILLFSNAMDASPQWEHFLEDLVYVIAAVVPSVGGVVVGKRFGVWPGVAAGIALFFAVVLILVGAGYGY